MPDVTSPPTDSVTWLDRLRIERAVWSLDTRIQALPGRSRRAIRREIRANLRAAAGESGAAQAVRQLGDLRRLADGYLDGEYGEGRPRARYLQATFWTVGVELVIIALFFTGFEAFMAGLETRTPAPDGSYVWHGAQIFGLTGEVAYSGGQFDGMGVAFSAVPFLLWLVVPFILGGRLWRLIPGWLRQRRGTPAVV